MFTGVVACLTTELPGNGNGAFAFQEANHLTDLVLWRNLDEHMDMVSHEMALKDFALLLVGKLMKDTAKPGTYLTVQLLATTLGNEDQVILGGPILNERDCGSLPMWT